MNVIEKQGLADVTPTSVFETAQRFGRLKTPNVFKCLDLPNYIINLLEPLLTRKCHHIDRTNLLLLKQYIIIIIIKYNLQTSPSPMKNSYCCRFKTVNGFL